MSEHRVTRPQRCANALPFMGRERELSELRAGLDAARVGNGGLYLAAGEPGIGKTRLASEFAREAAAVGTWVLRGCSVEDSRAPPWRARRPPPLARCCGRLLPLED